MAKAVFVAVMIMKAAYPIRRSMVVSSSTHCPNYSFGRPLDFVTLKVGLLAKKAGGPQFGLELRPLSSSRMLCGTEALFMASYVRESRSLGGDVTLVAALTNKDERNGPG